MSDLDGLDEFDGQVAAVAALGDPVRRALYRYVAASPQAVGRDEAASAVGVARHTAKFHLDRLEADGLLTAEYRRPAERRGPGAGRPAKLYRRSTREVSVSLPDRRYDMVGRVLACAITTAAATGESIAVALRESARTAGQSLGEQARLRLGRHRSRAAQLEATRGVLAECGYEPRVTGEQMILANCPFHSLAEEYTDLVCGVNLDVVDGLLSRFDRTSLQARLDPCPGRCCVTLTAKR